MLSMMTEICVCFRYYKVVLQKGLEAVWTIRTLFSVLSTACSSTLLVRKSSSFIALIMSILGGKRIGFAALLVGIVATYLFRRLAILQKRRNRVLTLLIALASINVTALNLATIAGHIYSDAHVEQVMNGRYAVSNELERVMKNRSWRKSITGSGPGSALALIERISEMTHPHNDWLKVNFDYGILGSTLLMIFMASIFSSSRTGPGIALATGVIMMTDNVIIYLYYWFPIVLMLRLFGAVRAQPGGPHLP